MAINIDSLIPITPIAASRIALERTLEEFQQVCQTVPCRTIKRKLRKNLDKISVSFEGLAAPADVSSGSAAAPAPAVENKAKSRK